MNTETGKPAGKSQNVSISLVENQLDATDSEHYLIPYDSNHRFGLNPILRLPIIFFVLSAYTVPMGLYRGGKIAGLRYLAENTHRLPRTQQGWYFYHKTKNYVVMKEAIIESCRYSLNTFKFALCFFGIEAGLDAARGTIDFLNTTASSCLVGLLYSFSSML